MKTFPSAALAGGLLSLALAAGAPAATIVGLTTDNRILTFDHLAPGVTFTNVAISGMPFGSSLIGIDLRPATGRVTGVGTDNFIYDIDPLTGVATRLGSGFAAAGLESAEFGIDFNPTVDRIRVVSSNSGNRRLNPVTGGAVLPLDPALTYSGTGAPVRAVGVAYTNSLAGVAPGTTRQFIIDSDTDMLVETGSQAGGNASFNAGVVTPIGSLGFDTGDLVGFDIFGPTGVALISTTPTGGGTSSLRLLNLSDASSLFLGDIAGGTIRDITVIPAPAGAAMALATGLGAAIRRRR